MTAVRQPGAGTAAVSPGAAPSTGAGRAAAVDVSAALDVLRGLAAVCMVVNHVGAQLVDPAVLQRGVAAWVFFVSSAAPVLFFFASGVAGALRRADGRWWSRLDTVGLLLLADLFFAWRNGAPWGLDFFGFIAIVTLSVDLVARHRHAARLALGLAVALVAVRFVGAPLLWDQASRWPLVAWLVGFPAVHGVSYPLTPWLCYALLGLALGRWCRGWRAPVPLWRGLGWLALAVVLGGGLAGIAIGRGWSLNRWTTVSAGYLVCSLAVIVAMGWLAVAVAALPRLSAGLRLRGVAAFAVVPVHYGLIALLHATGVAGLGATGYALAVAVLVVAALAVARGFAALLQHAARSPWLRPGTALAVVGCAAVLWAGHGAHGLLFGAALVVGAQLAIAAWLLPAAKLRPTTG